MSYSVTLLDKQADWATVFVGPDRPVEVTRRKAITNYQRFIEWPEHAPPVPRNGWKPWNGSSTAARANR